MKVWCPDEGDEGEAGDSAAVFPFTAAEWFAESRLAHETFDSILVNVRDRDGDLCKFRVHVYRDPTFRAEQLP